MAEGRLPVLAPSLATFRPTVLALHGTGTAQDPAVMGHWPTTSTASTQGAEAAALSLCSPSLEDSGAQAKPCRGRGLSLYVLQLREPVLCVMNALHVLWCPPRVTPVALSAKHGFSLPTCCLSDQLHLCNQSEVEHAPRRAKATGDFHNFPEDNDKILLDTREQRDRQTGRHTESSLARSPLPPASPYPCSSSSS